MHPIIVPTSGHEPPASRLALRLGAELVDPSELARATGREAVVVVAVVRPANGLSFAAVLSPTTLTLPRN
jgi:hypothetical protein